MAFLVLPNRFRISKSATDTLKLLKMRTGVTPNILCRIALMLSLEEGLSRGEQTPDLEGSEFNAPTLFGEHAQIYDCFIRQVHGTLDARQYNLVVASHVDNGLEHLKRCRTLLDLGQFLVPIASRAQQ